MKKNLVKPLKFVLLFNTINAYGGEGCSMGTGNKGCGCNGYCPHSH